MSAAPLPPVTLQGARVLLEPLSLAHVPGLTAVATGPRDTFNMTFVPVSAEATTAYVQLALDLHARGEALAFAVLDRTDGAIVGTTRFAMLERWTAWPTPPKDPRFLDAVEIGWTWLSPRVQRSRVNTEMKRLMLAHAFETWGVRRVLLKTDERNARSRAAIERLGARLDGVLRAHSPASDGTVRNTATYSILESEWPQVRARLDERLERGG